MAAHPMTALVTIPGGMRLDLLSWCFGHDLNRDLLNLGPAVRILDFKFQVIRSQETRRGTIERDIGGYLEREALLVVRCLHVALLHGDFSVLWCGCEPDCRQWARRAVRFDVDVKAN